MDRIKKGDSKPRWYDKPECDFDVHDCPDSGGKYQELKTLGAFVEAVPGTKEQRWHERNYCKVELAKKPTGEDGLGGLALKEDTSGPPYLNISVPKRIL
jgi:hypothetical protein